MKTKIELHLSSITAIATVCIFFASCLKNQAEVENQAAEAEASKPRVIELGDNVDEEQMRLTKLIRERILKQVEKDAHKATPAEGSQGKATPAEGSQGKAYTEELDTGASFEMLPVKGGSFRWQGEQADDVIEATISPFLDG